MVIKCYFISVLMLAYQAVIGDMELWAFNVLFSELCVSICSVDGLNVGIYSMFFLF